MARKNKGKPGSGWSSCVTASSRPEGGSAPTAVLSGRAGAARACSGGESPPPLGNAVYAGSLCKVFFEEADALRALDKALRIYLRSYANAGQARVRILAPNRAEIRFVGGQAASRPHCLSTLAYLRDAVHLATGARVEAHEELCSCKGDPHCSHQISWHLPVS